MPSTRQTELDGPVGMPALPSSAGQVAPGLSLWEDAGRGPTPMASL